MSSVNTVILLGNVGADPEVRYMKNGNPVANVSLATNNTYKNNSGEKVQETEWHRLVFFGKLAEIVGEYVTKGMTIFVEGRKKTSKYTDKDNIERYAVDIICHEMKMLGKNGGRDEEEREPNQAGRGNAGAGDANGDEW